MAGEGYLEFVRLIQYILSDVEQRTANILPIWAL